MKPQGNFIQLDSAPDLTGLDTTNFDGSVSDGTFYHLMYDTYYIQVQVIYGIAWISFINTSPESTIFILRPIKALVDYLLGKGYKVGMAYVRGYKSGNTLHRVARSYHHGVIEKATHNYIIIEGGK